VLGPVLDAEASRITSLERLVTDQGRTNERLVALERSGGRAVTPASARRPPHSVVEHTNLRWAQSDDDLLFLKEGWAVDVSTVNYNCFVDASTSFDTGTHAWKLLVTKTDTFMGVGVSYTIDGTHIELSLYVGTGEWQRDTVSIEGERASSALAKVDAPWLDSFQAGDVVDVTYACKTGKLSIGLADTYMVSHKLDEFASKRVSPCVFLCPNNACEFVGDDAIVPACRQRHISELTGLMFNSFRCAGKLILSRIFTTARCSSEHGTAIASTSFDSGLFSWKVRFTQTDRIVGIGVVTADDLTFCKLFCEPMIWCRSRINEWQINNANKVGDAHVSWFDNFENGSVIKITYDCGTGTLSIGHEGSHGVVSHTLDEFRSKRVSPYVFLTSGNTCEFVD